MLCINCGTATNDDSVRFCASCCTRPDGVWQSPQSELVAKSAIVYAGFPARFAALILDILLLGISGIGLFYVLAIGIGLASVSQSPRELDGDMRLIMGGFYGTTLLMLLAYFVLMESGARGATLGKRALRLRVVDVTGQRIRKARALGRFFVRFLSCTALCIGYLIQPFTKRKQALHDVVAGTLVVKADTTNGGLAIALYIVGGLFVLIVGVCFLGMIALPPYQQYLAKANVFQAEMVGRAATHAVENYAVQTGKIPASLAQTGVKLPPAPEVANVTVNPQNGQVQVVIGKGMPAAAAGKALVFDASRNSAGKIVWTCMGPGIPKQMLPPDCH